MSQKQIARETGISWKTVQKMIKFPTPPGYRRKKPIDRCKLQPCAGLIDGIVKEDQGRSKKQQHTARQIWEWLREKHAFTGGYTIVKDYVREARHRTACISTSEPSQFAPNQCALGSEDPAELTYELIQSVPKREAIRLLRVMFGGGPPQVDREGLNQLLEPFAIKETRGTRRLKATQVAFNWMRNVLQGDVTSSALANELEELSDLNKLVTVVTEGRLSDRNRALAVLARGKGFTITDVCEFLNLSRASVLKYCRRYHEGGIALLMAGKIAGTTKFDKEPNKQAVFSLLHTPPSVYGVNRTTWRMADLQEVLGRQDVHLCKDVIRAIFKEAGYKWRSARVVLTSRDPEYRTKVEAITKILSELGQDEAFFSIDEYGPFAVKQKGGVKRVAPGQEYVVPQWQKSKGWMILTAALELSRNHVTHFYSSAKNTEEMIRMADLLRDRYRTCSTIYLSWDAASWHISKKLLAHVEKLNQEAADERYPIVKTAPLPAGAQFLNVIESVFSGMARAIIHNSDYPSIGAAQEAIGLYFAKRNDHFAKHPKRAGQKIWGKERVPSEFLEGQNCKDPQYR
ncbi:MAG: IS630 family transposase [Acidobacteriota bacterium]|nr:IS630 family transposase [Acidobacteriota bacterium]